MLLFILIISSQVGYDPYQIHRLFLSTNAWAITAGEACNSDSDNNTCENGTLFICPDQDYPNEGAVENQWYAYDCGSKYAGTTCGAIGTIDTCVASSGEQCLFQEQIIQDQSGDDIPTNAGDYQLVPCGDTGTGCDAFVSGKCNTIDACTPVAEGDTFAPVCDDNINARPPPPTDTPPSTKRPDLLHQPT